jgi:hypothetical protein
MELIAKRISGSSFMTKILILTSLAVEDNYQVE